MGDYIQQNLDAFQMAILFTPWSAGKLALPAPSKEIIFLLPLPLQNLEKNQWATAQVTQLGYLGTPPDRLDNQKSQLQFQYRVSLPKVQYSGQSSWNFSAISFWGMKGIDRGRLGN